MATNYRFRLPEGLLRVAPKLRVNGEVAQRQFILLFDLPENPDIALSDPSLSWSESFRSFYRYAPAAGSAGIIHAPAFVLPEQPRLLRVRIQQRQRDSRTVVEDLALATELGDRPALLFAERGDR